jgi:hypothetical protein
MEGNVHAMKNMFTRNGMLNRLCVSKVSEQKSFFMGQAIFEVHPSSPSIQ